MLVVDVFGEPFTEVFAPGEMPPAYPHSVALNGTPFELDLKDRFLYETLQSLREAQDTGVEPGESSLSTQAAWIRRATDFQSGAGQQFFDAAQTDRARFWRSEAMAIDWPGEARLGRVRKEVAGPVNLIGRSAVLPHHRHDKVLSVAWSEPAVALWFSLLAYDDQAGVVVEAQGPVADTVQSVVHSLWIVGGHYLVVYSDGWAVQGLDDALPFTFPVGFPLAHVTRATGILVGTRLIVHTWAGGAGDPAIVAEYNPLTGATIGSPILDAATGALYGFDGVAADASTTHLYLAFVRGDQSQIWRVGLETTGSGTDLVAAPAAPSAFLGEHITDIVIESNVMVIGTRDGVRIAEIGPDGNLSVGPLTEHWPVERMALTKGYGYVTTTDVHAQVAGLPATPGVVRLDLSRFVDDAALVPQWSVVATDPGVGAWSAPVVHGDHLTWTTHTGWSHLYARADMPAASTGWLDTGWIDFGLSYPKMLSDVEIVWKPRTTRAGAIETRIRYEDDDVPWRLVSTDTLLPGHDSARIELPGIRPRRFALRFDLLAVGGEADPVLRSWAVRGLPIVPRNTEVILPVICKPEVSRHPLTGRQLFVATAEIIAFFDRFIASGEVVTMALGPNRYRVRVNGQRYQATQHKGPDDLFGGVTNVSVLIL